MEGPRLWKDHGYGSTMAGCLCGDSCVAKPRVLDKLLSSCKFPVPSAISCVLAFRNDERAQLSVTPV